MRFQNQSTPQGPPPQLEVGSGKKLEDRVRMLFGAMAISVMDPYTMRLAYKLVQDCKSNDEECEVKSVFQGLRDLFEYRGEIRGFDVFRTLRRSVETKSADCDCATIALGSVLSALEYRVGARTVIVDIPGVGKDWGHVYSIVSIPKWGKTQVVFPMDLGVPRDFGSKPGWETSPVYGKKDFWFEPDEWLSWYTSVDWNTTPQARGDILKGMPTVSGVSSR